MRSTSTWAAALAVVVGLGSATASADVASAAGRNTCTLIKRVPVTITRSGDYCLAFSLAIAVDTGFAIKIAADDVKLDLRGFELDGRRSAGIASDAIGILGVDRRRLTIRNGTILGFQTGIALVDARDSGIGAGHVVEKIHVKGASGIGINVTSRDGIIRNCVVTDISGIGAATGIREQGAFSRLTDNRVEDVRTTQPSPNAFSAGIDLVDNQTRTVVGNRIDGVFGGAGNFGIRCGDRFSRVNQVRHADVPFSVCSDNPYPYPYPYPTGGGSHGHGGRRTRYGMAAMGVLVAGAALLKKFLVV